ncbi:MAG: endonuclease III [Pseudomonadota bacterium]
MTTLLRPNAIRKIFQTFAEANPEPKTELNYQTPYTLLVAVVLSAQATDIGVNKVTEKLFADATTPEAMLELGEAGISGRIRSLGLFRNKAKNVALLSRQLLERHGGQVPEDRSQLEALAGVGRKTANVVLSQAFGHHTIAVDTHVFRVANRTGLAPAAKESAVENELMRIIPKRFLKYAHHWLILHGRYVCKAQKPACDICKIAKWCAYPNKAEVDSNIVERQ